ncbi:sugar transporter [Mannheimia sp. AT1]|uniref:Sugar transporter n=1 Tax=Mannheimia cairinae TaxID=3025936 RepID=A0ABT5ML17_9PAST|nr:sugar transporter [Mannheimia cairinae]MDD0822884.1 sugar transporter [Mannheimia cairinae]MDD0826088.1 sugar transporter [Mannheimia cairinae]
MISRKIQRKLAFFRVFALAFAAFIVNTTEFIPVALLSDIATSFQMDTSTTGLMITVYAWVVFLLSLPLMLLTAKMERKSLLIKLFIIFTLSHILSVIAWNFWILLISRAMIAITHAIFWSITASLVIRMAPRDKKSQALGLLALGSSLAMILGLPLGRMIGQAFGWRATFAIIGIIAFIMLLIIWKLLPYLPSKNAGSMKSVPILFKRPMLIGIYLLVALVVSGHFTSYSYIEPFMVQISQVKPQTATFILLVFGLAGVVASFLFGRLYAKAPKKFIVVGIMIVMLGQLCLLPLSDSTVSMFILVFIWGIGITGMSIALQMKVLELSPDATDVATAIFSGVYNMGIGGGALIGSLAMKHIGLPYIGFVGGSLAGIAVCWFIFISIRYRNA